MEMLRPDGVSLDDPYVPESVLKALVPGQRVRYVPRGECDAAPALGSTGYLRQATLHETQFEAENMVGIIVQPTNLIVGHPYRVLLDEQFSFAGRSTWRGVVAAASELVLIEDE